MAEMNEIRPSPIAGSWYSDDPQVLAGQIDGYLEDAELPAIQGEIVGLIAPHAGYRYSGPTAGYAYASVEGLRFDRVVIASPYHQFYDADLLISGHSAYRTPFDDVPIDISLLMEIAEKIKQEGITVQQVTYDEEHSLEIQLPFLQRVLSQPFKLLPFMVRTQELNQVRGIAKMIAEGIKGNNALLVASTDLSHFYTAQDAQQLDQEMLQRIEKFSPEKVLEAERDGCASACGAGAVATILETAKYLGANKVQVLHYATSAESSGDYSSVVGYGAAVITK